MLTFYTQLTQHFHPTTNKIFTLLWNE